MTPPDSSRMKSDGQALLSGAVSGLLMNAVAAHPWIATADFVMDEDGNYLPETRVALKRDDGTLDWYVVSVEPEVETG